jgi:hypothetical protein
VAIAGAVGVEVLLPPCVRPQRGISARRAAGTRTAVTPVSGAREGGHQVAQAGE